MKQWLVRRQKFEWVPEYLTGQSAVAFCVDSYAFRRRHTIALRALGKKVIYEDHQA